MSHSVAGPDGPADPTGRPALTLPTGIDQVRNAVCAILRTRRREVRRKKQTIVEVQCSIVGTAWCVGSERYLVTARHVLNEGREPQEGDKYYALMVPGNGPTAHHFPIAGVRLSNSNLDLAVIEVMIPPASQHLPAIAILGHRPPDGSRVFTYGFPAPEIAHAVVGPDGSYLGGGQMFLKGHANEGIIAGQFEFDGGWHYEFNVGWHHGESGGPILLESEGAAFAVMQGYRGVKSPHGVFAGPHGGRGIEGIRDALRDFDATVI